jgi:acyl-CoA synthetase (AMP-forming)/AMP-acid ligase II
MIKSGGNRISPKEVEEIIQEVEGVQEVAVVGVNDELLGEIIKAYVVPMKDARIDTKAIQLHCRKNLAVYKIPKSVELIDKLPKTASGKVQRFLLQ